MIKRSYTVQMAYNVTDAEKMQATRAIIAFDHAIKSLDVSDKYLDLMKTPFKENPEISPDEIMKTRTALRRFRDKAVENFNNFKKIAFKCVNLMSSFASDTQTTKLIKSFIASIQELEALVNEFVSLFDNLEDKNFINQVVSKIEQIQDKCKEIVESIEERIKNHIHSNILAKNWINQVSDDLQIKVQEKTPLILDLFNARQNKLNEMIEDRTNIGT